MPKAYKKIMRRFVSTCHYCRDKYFLRNKIKKSQLNRIMFSLSHKQPCE